MSEQLQAVTPEEVSAPKFKSAIDVLFLVAQSGQPEKDIRASCAHECAKAHNRMNPKGGFSIETEDGGEKARTELINGIKLNKIQKSNIVFDLKEHKSRKNGRSTFPPKFLSPTKLLSDLGKQNPTYLATAEYLAENPFPYQDHVVTDTESDIDDQQTGDKTKSTGTTEFQNNLLQDLHNQSMDLDELEKIRNDDQSILEMVMKIQKRLTNTVSQNELRAHTNEITDSIEELKLLKEDIEERIPNMVEDAITEQIPSIAAKVANMTDVDHAGFKEDLIKLQTQMTEIKNELDTFKISNTNPDTDPLAELTIYESDSSEYINSVWTATRAGRFKGVCIKGNFTCSNGNEVDVPVLATYFSCNFKVTGTPWRSKANNLVFNGNFTGKTKDDSMFNFMKHLLKYRNDMNADGIGFSLITPKKYNIDRILRNWVNKSIICMFDLTRLGFYFIIIRNGTKDLPKEGNFTFSELYLASCSRIVIQNPLALIKMLEPTTEKLVKIANNTHFPASSGKLVEIPPGQMATKYLQKSQNLRNELNQFKAIPMKKFSTVQATVNSAEVGAADQRQLEVGAADHKLANPITPTKTIAYHQIEQQQTFDNLDDKFKNINLKQPEAQHDQQTSNNRTEQLALKMKPKPETLLSGVQSSSPLRETNNTTFITGSDGQVYEVVTKPSSGVHSNTVARNLSQNATSIGQQDARLSQSQNFFSKNQFQYSQNSNHQNSSPYPVPSKFREGTLRRNHPNYR